MGKEKLEKIVWMDACERTLNMKEIEKSQDGVDLLSVNMTYGVVYKVFPKVLAILHEKDSQGDMDITSIPRYWIVSPEKYRI